MDFPTSALAALLLTVVLVVLDRVRYHSIPRCPPEFESTVATSSSAIGDVSAHTRNWWFRSGRRGSQSGTYSALSPPHATVVSYQYTWNPDATKGSIRWTGGLLHLVENESLVKLFDEQGQLLAQFHGKHRHRIFGPNLEELGHLVPAGRWRSEAGGSYMDLWLGEERFLLCTSGGRKDPLLLGPVEHLDGKLQAIVVGLEVLKAARRWS